MQWLMFQMVGVRPMFGQAHYFLRNPKEIIPYGQKRYGDGTNRLYAVVDDHFENSRYFPETTIPSPILPLIRGLLGLIGTRPVLMSMRTLSLGWRILVPGMP